MEKLPQIFLSHSEEDAFEAGLLQSCIETSLSALRIRVWSYKRDQSGDERSIAKSLPKRVEESVAAIFLISQYTLKAGGTQYMELAYADAFGVPSFILLHHITFQSLKRSQKNVPPLVIEGHCTPASDWHTIMPSLEKYSAALYSASETSDVGFDNVIANLSEGEGAL
jgi:hypothetical protein